MVLSLRASLILSSRVDFSDLTLLLRFDDDDFCDRGLRLRAPAQETLSLGTTVRESSRPSTVCCSGTGNKFNRGIPCCSLLETRLAATDFDLSARDLVVERG